MRIFDVYRGEQVGEGKKSVALSLVFQSAERTLSDEDAAALRARIVDALAERFGAELRGGVNPILEASAYYVSECAPPSFHSPPSSRSRSAPARAPRERRL